jgi:uncharacterized protein (DUF1015 family)
MAEIRPLRGWKYHPEIGKLEDLTSPLFDLSEKSLLEQLYKNPYNINHLFLPRDTEEAARNLHAWKKDHILVQDPLPAIYAYSQSFHSKLTGKKKEITGFITNVRLHEWRDQVILRHENIMPHSVSHRSEIFEKTRMHFCPLHALYTDEQLHLEPWVLESLSTPFAEVTDLQGVTHKISMIHDLEIIGKFQDTLGRKPVILADGHHRYEAALRLYRESGYKEDHLGYLPMFLTNTESNELEIFPTHRLVKNLSHWNREVFLAKLNDYFRVDLVEDPYRLEPLLEGKKHCFGLIFKDLNLFLSLKPDAMQQMSWKFPEQIKKLDLTVLHYFIIEKGLNIDGKDQKNSKNINFSFNFINAVSKIQQGEYQLGIITGAVTQEEIKEVCYSGYTLPHKSTYFFPKVLCGLVSGSIEENDFRF